MNGLQGISGYGLGLLIERALSARTQSRGLGADSSASATSSTPPAAAQTNQDLTVSRPVGETGANIGSISTNNSFIRMFMIETSHLAAHTRQVGALGELVSQDVRLNVAVTGGGTPVAVGGSAQTSVRGADGTERVLRELAYVPGFGAAGGGSAASMVNSNALTMPPITLADGSAAGARRALDDRAMLLSARDTRLYSLVSSLSPRSFSAMAGELGKIAQAFERLGERFRAISQPGAFAPATATSSSPLFVQAEPGLGAEPGSYTVEVVRAAHGQSITSDVQTSNPLGLRGSFKVNGVTVSVAATDTLFDIGRNINLGEDVNHSGALDAGEDTNGDYRLSGGTAEHGVRATFYENRLTLTRVDSLVADVNLSDPDRILESVGLLEMAKDGSINPKHVTAAAQDAMIRVDGSEFRSTDNVFTDAIKGVTLTIAGEPGQAVAVQVARSTEAATSAVKAALDEFNSAVRAMNTSLSAEGGLLSRDPAASRARLDLVQALVAPVPGQPEDLSEAADAGLERKSDRATFSEGQLASAANDETSGAARHNALRPATAPPSVYNALDQLGIVSSEDDTFTLNEERFGSVLTARAAEVAELFTRAGEGIASRVLGRISANAGEDGLLAMRRAALESMAASDQSNSLGGTDVQRTLLASLQRAD